MNEYAIFFYYEGITLRLPVNPESFTISIPSTNKTETVIGIGEITLIKEPGLREISFESFLPAEADNPYVVKSGGFYAPTVYLDFWRRMKVEKKPFVFIVNRFLPGERRIHDTSMDMTLEDYEVTEHGGEAGDFYYSLKLREYRKFGVRLVE